MNYFDLCYLFVLTSRKFRRENESSPATLTHLHVSRMSDSLSFFLTLCIPLYILLINFDDSNVILHQYSD